MKRLEQELDIELFIRNSRFFTNSMRLLLTPIERKLLRMQDNRSVIKRPNYTVPNSDLESDKYIEYLDDLQDKINSQQVRLSSREIQAAKLIAMTDDLDDFST